MLLARSFGILMMICCATAYAGQHEACFNEASKHFKVEKDLLIAIATWESSMKPNAIGKRNKDGTEDYGLMQINSSHLPLLRKAGFKNSDLFDPCTSIYIGAFLLDGCIKHEGKKWRAVGCYNAGPRKNREHAKQVYVNNVRRTYDRLKRNQKVARLETKA